MFPAAFFVDGEEALEGEASGGQTADGQGVDGGAAAGNGPDLHAVFCAQPHQILAGVRDGGGAGVRHQSAGFPGQQSIQNALPGGDVIVLVIADQRLFHAEMVQKLHGHTGVLRGDEVRVFQRFHRTGGEIPQIADGRSYQI